MQKNSENSLHQAVVLHIAYTGYGVVRSLASAGIPVTAFQKDTSAPEAKSSLCRQVISFTDDLDLLGGLVDLAKDHEKKPVLFITSDIYVEFYLKYRELLKDLYLIHYPDTETAGMLLNKDLFLDYAARHSLPVPRSFKINSEQELQAHSTDLTFPVIVKPFTKSPAWLAAKLDKAFYADSPGALISLYNKVKTVEPRLLVQEWVPGPDGNVEYCLTYFDNDSNCLACFTGAKIRQWPVGTGSTASTKPVDNQLIKDLTISLFSSLGYRGFGSVEFKKHESTGRYYIMEPTVGRPNQQSYVATANGLNMPLIAYNSLTGLDIGQPVTKINEPVYYIDEWADIGSMLVHVMRGQNCLGEFIGLLGKKKAFRYFDRRDMKVFGSSCLKLVSVGRRRLQNIFT